MPGGAPSLDEELLNELQLEIEFEDTVLVDMPAWIAHVILPLAFALISYRFLVCAGRELATLTMDLAEKRP